MIRAQNSNLNIRLSKSLKDSFVKICKEQNTNYSKLLREFIREYLKRYKHECYENRKVPFS